MYKTLASRLTAQFQVDGSHLDRYLGLQGTLKRSLLEDLILHDQILIPTPDFLTADGLILIFGEKGIIDLLESERIKFIRTRSVMGFARGSGKDGGLVVFSDPENKRPQDSDIEEAVVAGLNVIEGYLKEKDKLKTLVIQNSINVETTEILAAVGKESIADFRKSAMWRPRFATHNLDLLALPELTNMHVKVIGNSPNPLGSFVDTLLSLVMYNSDLFLSRKFDCVSTSSFFPIGDLLRIKASRAGNKSNDLWKLFEVNSIPDFSALDFNASDDFRALHKATMTSNAESFRKWFHSLNNWEESEILREYLSVLHEVHWTQKLPTRIIRFITTTGLGFIPVVGQVASFVDSFAIDKIAKKNSPKFFIDDMRQLAKTKGLQKGNRGRKK